MHISFIVKQLIGVIGTILYFLSFQCKRNRNLFRIQFLSYLFYTTHLILIGAMTGAASYIVNTFRSLCLGSKWDILKGKAMCVLICVLQIAVLFFMWSGWISILPVAANIASTIGGYTHNPKKIRLATMCINSPLWIIYDICVGSWAGVLDELACYASTFVSIFRFGWKNLDTIDK